MKRLCAKAALDLVPDHGIIGLGGGETISYLAEYIKEARKGVKVVTPSDHTAQVCKKLGLEIVDTKEVKEIEIAFDGCDQVDSDLDAYKSGGGIHTLEKIIAKMAKEYVLLPWEGWLHRLQKQPGNASQVPGGYIPGLRRARWLLSDGWRQGSGKRTLYARRTGENRRGFFPVRGS